MKLIFESVTIEGFQSIGSKVTLNLRSQGFVAIKGINEYENKASSNGSGKSSTLESINWCIFGKTSSGVSDVKNRYYPDGCCVSLEFLKDETKYTITRSLDHKKFKSKVQVLKGTEDISCRNKTDTNKLILDRIIPFNQDIFLSTIFLSQGFSGRLSLLTPSARKERLEVLANIDEAINKFKTSISDLKALYTNKVSDLNSKISYLNGQLDIYSKERESTEKLKNDPETPIPDISIDSMILKLNNLKTTLSEVNTKQTNLLLDRSKLSSKALQLEKSRTTLKNKLESLEAKLGTIETKCECPTCHQVITNTISENLVKEFTSEKDDIEKTLISEEQELIECTKQMDQFTVLISSTKEKKNLLEDMYKRTETTINEYEQAVRHNADIQSKLARLSECLEQISRLTTEIEKLDKITNKATINLNITDHMLKLITKEFRTYILSDVVNQMNRKLAEYSKDLFENESDVIRIATDDTKLNIYLDTSLYETLSGGEKKKVDIALVLAQRDIALRLSGFQTNILVCDEILENMDEQAANISLNLLNHVSDEVESLFIISHNNYAIPVDLTITVTKGRDRLSKISFT